MTTKWVINGLTFDINPNKDSGFIPVRIKAEHNPVGSNFTIIQHGGFASPTRTISGITKSKALRDGILNTYLSAATVNCSDQDGVSFRAQIREEPKFDVHIDTSNEENNFQSYDFEIELIKR